MAKATKNVPEVVTPPPTFTVELSEAEMATIVLYLGSSIPVEFEQRVRCKVDHSETGKAARFLVKEGFPDPFRLYAAFRDAFNA